VSVLSGVAVAAVAMSLASGPAQAQSAPAPAKEPGHKNRSDNLPNPLAERQAALQQEAVAKLVKGEAKVTQRGKSRVIEMKGKGGKSKYAWYPVEREESIFTILTDFGTQTKEPQGGTPGPVHNNIPQPDRKWDGNSTDDNSTYWASDFNRQHYQDMMFGSGNSFKDFYQKQSNGKFLAKGDVSDWVKVPYNEARYGHNPATDEDGNVIDGTSEAEGYWNYIKDTATAWYNDQKAKGKTDAEIKTYLAQFDKVDRYDYDQDGDYNEPDGYIDHFQAIHAGEGEEAGGGKEGEDAIWSHRWYAFSTNAGRTGPEQNKLGGVPLGDSGIWIGDYTTEPENGGLGVFTHEFGHDLGLPDYYDTTKGGDNGTGFWTLMSGGSWLNDGTDSIGTEPGYMGPREKLQLGWLDYTVATKSGRYNLGPADRAATDKTQAIVVPLKDKQVTTSYNKPHSGTNEWWSGTDDSLTATLTRTVDLTGKTSASMSAWAWYGAEKDYDYWYVEASKDGGSTWSELAKYTGDVKSWNQLTWDLSAYAGAPVQVRFRYASDGGVNHEGLFLDDFAVTADGASVFTDDVESGDNGWAAREFTRMTGTTSQAYPNYYILENRVYSGYDKYLRSGPYNFGWAETKPDWVERFPYQNGMLVWYVDESQKDNNTNPVGGHPGSGQSLPVDARPTPVRFYDGTLLGNRRQPFDATFGREKTDAVTFHKDGIATVVPKQAAIPTFDDAYPTKYWTADNPKNSVKVAGSGMKATVVKSKGMLGEKMVIDITAPTR
jgi:immune inhibitor A